MLTKVKKLVSASFCFSKLRSKLVKKKFGARKKRCNKTASII